MKKIIKLALLSAIFLTLSSCSPKIYSVVGTYNVIDSAETTLSYDEVWNNVIDFFATCNIPIATIEKASGVIVTRPIDFTSKVAIENSEGRIYDKTAWFVAPYQDRCQIISVIGHFNVRVRQLTNGNTYIAINMGKVEGVSEYYDIWWTGGIYTYHFECRSTGVFENMLLSLFK